MAKAIPSCSGSVVPANRAVQTLQISKKTVQSPLVFKTPTPTVRLAPITPTNSPTEENKLYSGVDLALKTLGTINTLDLNARSIDAEYSISPAPKKNPQLGRLAKSHWSMGRDHPLIDSSITHNFFDWFSTTNSEELNRLWHKLYYSSGFPSETTNIFTGCCFNHYFW